MFDDIVNRTRSIDHWQKIPWDDPDFSRRMLNEHLSQAHDAASRRASIIDQQVAWIEANLLQGRPSSVLDLGCGPGLYTARLAALGHSCTGIDFSTASIAYARDHSDGTYLEGSLLEVAYGSGYDLVMLLFGELNAFAPEDAALIVAKAYDALKPGGILLLEPHTFDGVVAIGREPASWHSSQSGLFSDQPYLCLSESWLQERDAISRYYVIDAASGEATTYLAMHHAYSEQDYRDLLRRFHDMTFYPSLAEGYSSESLCGIVAYR